jgi:hypothetical protein
MESSVPSIVHKEMEICVLAKIEKDSTPRVASNRDSAVNRLEALAHFVHHCPADAVRQFPFPSSETCLPPSESNSTTPCCRSTRTKKKPLVLHWKASGFSQAGAVNKILLNAECTVLLRSRQAFCRRASEDEWMMAAAYGRPRVPTHVWSGERSMSWRRLSPAGKAGQGAEARYGAESF